MSKIIEKDIIEYLYKSNHIDIDIFRDFLINEKKMSKSLTCYYIKKFTAKKYISQSLIIDKAFIKKVFSL